MNRTFTVVVCLVVTAMLGACSSKTATPAVSPPTLHFTAIPDQSSTELAQKFQPLAEHLSKQLGIKVEYIPASDYQASVEMFKNGDAPLAWFGGLTGVQARAAVPGARAIAQGDSDPAYVSYFVAHSSTGLEPSESFPLGIADLKFTFGSESSTSGRLMPEYFLRQATGKAPADFFKQPAGFSGSHDKTLELVATGQYQAGVVNFKVYERRVKEGKTDPAVCRVIWKTPPYTDYNWTAHPALETTYGAGFTETLQAVLVAIQDPALLAALPRERLIPAKNEDYEQIALVARELGMVR